MIFKPALFFQLVRFGIIGLTAAALNMIVVIFLVETFSIHPLIANIVAFLIAFNVSYFGHRHWTFANKEVSHKIALSRFFIIAISSFALNETLFYIFLSNLHLHYISSLLLVIMIVPIFTFFCSKFWAFGSFAKNYE